MPNQGLTITQFVRDAVRKHALSDIVKHCKNAISVYDTSEHLGPMSFGMALWGRH